MALIAIPWHSETHQLRQFGLCALPALPLLGWFLLGRTWPADWTVAGWCLFGCFLAAGLVCGTLALLWPRALHPVFLAAVLVTFPIGLVVSELTLLLLYFGVFTPMAALFRLLGRDPLQRRFDPTAASYWTPRRPARAEEYFRQS